jgi:hypothetical protein
MGLEKTPKKPKLPPVFTGEAIEIRFPDINLNGKTQEFRVITFPDWIHRVYVDDQMYDVLGEDLEVGMAFPYEGIFIIITDLDKKYLYHGLQVSNRIGNPCDPKEYIRRKFKRTFKEDGTQAWEISIKEEITN